MEQKKNKNAPVRLIEVDTIMSIHYFEFGADFNFSGETHDYWELVYIDRGKARVSANSVLLKLSQGEIIFHRPGEVHAIASDPTDPPTVFIITFRSGSEYMSFFSGRRMTVPTPLRRYISEMISDGQEAYILTDDSPYERELVRREDGLIGSEQLIIMNLEMLLIKLIRSCSLPKLKNENTKNYDPLTTRVVEMLNNSVYGRITVDAISKELGFSRTHISSEFKKCCGKTISEYMTELKVSEAKYLIRKRLYTVSQISDFLCYDNPHYFFRVFKKETGMTPRQYALSVSFPDKFAKKT
jgi:AraC-like DNA-binding protein